MGFRMNDPVFKSFRAPLKIKPIRPVGDHKAAILEAIGAQSAGVRLAPNTAPAPLLAHRPDGKFAVVVRLTAEELAVYTKAATRSEVTIDAVVNEVVHIAVADPKMLPAAAKQAKRKRDLQAA
jgi:hypothetical protein